MFSPGTCVRRQNKKIREDKKKDKRKKIHEKKNQSHPYPHTRPCVYPTANKNNNSKKNIWIKKIIIGKKISIIFLPVISPGTGAFHESLCIPRCFMNSSGSNSTGFSSSNAAWMLARIVYTNLFCEKHWNEKYLLHDKNRIQSTLRTWNYSKLK